MTSRSEEDRKRVISIADKRNEFDYLDDGYLYYWPSGSGAVAAYELRIIADELDRRNAEWDAEVKAFFEQEKANEARDRT